jgi:hypothetical protein
VNQDVRDDSAAAGGRTSAERAAINESRFRDSNERINEIVDQYGLSRYLPFLCECADTKCTVLVRMNGDEYRHVRSNSRWFAVAPGHESAGGPHGRVVEEHESYVVVEKTGEAGEISDGLDGSDKQPLEAD